MKHLFRRSFPPRSRLQAAYTRAVCPRRSLVDRAVRLVGRWA